MYYHVSTFCQDTTWQLSDLLLRCCALEVVQLPQHHLRLICACEQVVEFVFRIQASFLPHVSIQRDCEGLLEAMDVCRQARLL